MVGGIEPGTPFTRPRQAGARSGRHLINVYDIVSTLVGLTGGQPGSIYPSNRVAFQKQKGMVIWLYRVVGNKRGGRVSSERADESSFVSL